LRGLEVGGEGAAGVDVPGGVGPWVKGSWKVDMSGRLVLSGKNGGWKGSGSVWRRSKIVRGEGMPERRRSCIWILCVQN